MSEKEVLERSLTYSTELEEAYLIYQNILHAFQEKDHPLFLELINQPTTLKEFIPVFKTFRTYQVEMNHTFNTTYSNGPLDCMNNHIKAVKRNVYGMRSFYNFKLRISICLKKKLLKHQKRSRKYNIF